MIYCDNCGWIPEEESKLPVLLPTDVEFTGKGESPIATSKTFKDVSCPKCGKKAEREVDTMDTFLDSSWYYLRYCDARNTERIFDKEKVDYWMNVDFASPAPGAGGYPGADPSGALARLLFTGFGNFLCKTVQKS